MTLLVETTDNAALPADIRQARSETHELPIRVHHDLDLYRQITCNVCGRDVADHVWVAIDCKPGGDVVLRCSNSETS
jgi:hypothetical protein